MLPSPLMSTVVGLLVTILSILIVFANIIVVRVVVRSEELYKVNAYKLIVAIGVADAVYAAVHVFSGASILARRSLRDFPLPALTKVADAIITPAYLSYVLFTLVLAVNRFALTYSSLLERKWFSRTGMRIWYSAVLTVAGGFFVILMTPYARISPYWEQFNYAYVPELPYSMTVAKCSFTIQIVGIPLAAILYILILVMIFNRRNAKSAGSRARRMEYRILFQAVTITVYALMSCIVWHHLKSPFEDVLVWEAVIAFLRIFNGAINPIVYVLANVTLRHRVRVKIANVAPSLKTAATAGNSDRTRQGARDRGTTRRGPTATTSSSSSRYA